MHEKLSKQFRLYFQYLKKQVAAIKEVNNSRLKVYENLESVINDLEHMNQQLENERYKDKNKIIRYRHTKVFQFFKFLRFNLILQIVFVPNFLKKTAQNSF